MQVTAEMVSSIAAVISTIVAVIGIYRLTTKEINEKSSGDLKLVIIEKLKSSSLTRESIEKEIQPLGGKYNAKLIADALYYLFKDKVVSISKEDNAYSLVTHDTKIDIAKYSFECIERWDSSDFRPFRDTIRRFFAKDSNQNKNELYKILESDKDLQRSLVFVFNYFQELSCKIQGDLVDRLIIYNSLGDAYIKIHDMFYGWVIDYLHIDTRMKTDLSRLYDDINKHNINS